MYVFVCEGRELEQNERETRERERNLRRERGNNARRERERSERVEIVLVYKLYFKCILTRLFSHL